MFECNRARAHAESRVYSQATSIHYSRLIFERKNREENYAIYAGTDKRRMNTKSAVFQTLLFPSFSVYLLLAQLTLLFASEVKLNIHLTETSLLHINLVN